VTSPLNLRGNRHDTSTTSDKPADERPDTMPRIPLLCARDDKHCPPGAHSDYGRNMSDDGLDRDGPACPECGREMNAETFATEFSVALVYTCPDHGIMTIRDPLE